MCALQSLWFTKFLMLECWSGMQSVDCISSHFPSEWIYRLFRFLLNLILGVTECWLLQNPDSWVYWQNLWSKAEVVLGAAGISQRQYSSRKVLSQPVSPSILPSPSLRLVCFRRQEEAHSFHVKETQLLLDHSPCVGGINSVLSKISVSWLLLQRKGWWPWVYGC